MKEAVKRNSFAKGNKLGGKPKGARNKATVLLEELTLENAFKITQAVIDMALAGDLAAAKLILDRIWQIPKPQIYVNKEYIKDMVTQEDANNAITNILNDVANSELSLEEAAQLMALIERKIDSVQLCIQEQLIHIQEQINNMHTNPN